MENDEYNYSFSMPFIRWHPFGCLVNCLLVGSREGLKDLLRFVALLVAIGFTLEIAFNGPFRET